LANAANLDIPVIGVAKAGWTLDQLKSRARDSVERYGGLDPDAFSRLRRLMDYIDSDYSDPADFSGVTAETGHAKRPTHYLAIRPACSRLSFIGSASRVRRGRRIVIEKPFGQDLATAKTLNGSCTVSLGRKTSSHRPLPGQKRSSKPALFPLCQFFSRPLWIDSSSKACKSRWRKTLASRGRGKFYDRTGALRDVVQNHLLQVLTNIAIGASARAGCRVLRDEKPRCEGIRPLRPGMLCAVSFAVIARVRRQGRLSDGNLRGVAA